MVVPGFAFGSLAIAQRQSRVLFRGRVGQGAGSSDQQSTLAGRRINCLDVLIDRFDG